MTGGVCTTPPEVPTVGVHWLRATTPEPVEAVVGRLATALGETVEVREGGMHGYSDTFVLGRVKLWHNPARPDMGCCVEVTGEACDELGPDGLLQVWDAAEWRASRVDLAVDYCPFTPAVVAEAWKRGDVDTRVKSLDPEGDRPAIAGREGWRRCEWVERPDGDLFGMGSRASGQYARVYDRRGFTRFELELKKTTAHVAGAVVMESLRQGVAAFRTQVLSLIQRFVRFVDRDASDRATRCPPLEWWARFVDGVEKSQLRVAQRVVRTIGEIVSWLERQVAPSLALVRKAKGEEVVEELIRQGIARWGPRQRESLRLAGVAA